MPDWEVRELSGREVARIRPLLVDLMHGEQAHYPDHPQLDLEAIEGGLGPLRSRFQGENVFFAVSTEEGALAGFCWCVLFDPGTGLEGEVAEVYVAPDFRGQGVGEALLERAVGLFRRRGVTLGYVWTRAENEPAVRLYQGAGFAPTTQMVLTWYPTGDH